MGVYVSPLYPMHQGNPIAHMYADQFDDLLDMADRLGLKGKFLMGHPVLSQRRNRKARFIHFTLTEEQWRRAKELGAVERVTRL